MKSGGGVLGDRAGNHGTVAGHQPAALVHPRGPEARERVEAEDVGLIARPQRPELGEAVVLGRVQRGQDEGVDLTDTGLDGELDAVVEVPHLEQCVGLAVIATESDVVGAVRQHGGDEVTKVLTGRSLADEDPHALTAFLLGLYELGAFVVGLDAGRKIRIEMGAREPGRVTVDPATAGGGDTGQHFGVTGDDAGKVHDLGHPDRRVLVEQHGDVGGEQLGTGALEGRRRYTTAGADPERERELAGRCDERSDAGDTEHVGHLVRVGGHGGRPQWQHGADELVDPQFCRLQVHVGIDEAGGHRRPVEVDLFDGLSGAPARHHAVTDGQVGGHPLPRRRRQDPPPAQKEIGRLIAAGDRQNVRRGRSAGHGACWPRRAVPSTQTGDQGCPGA